MSKDIRTMICYMIVFITSIIFLSNDIQTKLNDDKYVKKNHIKGNIQLVSKNKITEYVAEADIVKDSTQVIAQAATKKEEVEKEEAEKPVVPQVVNNGVATPGNAWATQPGWAISSDYGYRYDPFTGYRSFHGAIDIYGPGQGSFIYAVNNGIIAEKGWSRSYGYYLVINHNNGYYTLYAHLSGFVAGINYGTIVNKGGHIAYMGMTGSATGPHLHLEYWNGYPWKGGVQLNPWSLY